MSDELNEFGLNFSFFRVVESSECYFTIEIEITNVLRPVVDGYSMKLIGLKNHRIFVLHSDNHSYMIEVAVSENSLNFSSKVLSIEEKDVSGL